MSPSEMTLQNVTVYCGIFAPAGRGTLDLLYTLATVLKGTWEFAK